MSVTVRGETDRASTAVDDLRSYYLASSGVEKAAMELLWSAYGAQQYIPRDASFVDYQFPSGTDHVEIIPEAGKLDVNKASPDNLFKLLTALGVDPGRAGVIAAAIVDWRQGGNGSPYDSYYLSLTPSFQSPHASFQEIEELLSVRGVTPDIFYGNWSPASGGDPNQSLLVRHTGLVDCLTVYGGPGSVDINSADPAVLSALGVGSDIGQNILAQRAEGTGNRNITNLLMQGNAVITFRSTAHLRLPNGQFSDMRRTVGAQVMYLKQPAEVPYQVMRWYDTAWSN
jgi:general secretion pathway protein K